MRKPKLVTSETWWDSAAKKRALRDVMRQIASEDPYDSVRGFMLGWWLWQKMRNGPWIRA